MGQVVLPSGQYLYVEEIDGQINLSTIISDLQSSEYTNSYRIALIHVLSRLHRHAQPALQFLNELSNNPNALVAEAATQAVKKITAKGISIPVSGVAAPPANAVPNAVSRKAADDWTDRHDNRRSNSILKPKMEYKKVTLTPIECDGELHKGLRFYKRCAFCHKYVFVTEYQMRYSKQMADDYFCNFCLRNDYYHDFNKHVMLLTFRGIIGYYYYAYYLQPMNSTMYLSDIQEHLDLHVRMGLQNPLFRYDPDSFGWFVDFSKVGDTKHRLSVKQVLETIVEILASFNLYESVRGASPRKLYQKYENAILEFYKDRTRVNGQKMFAPTLMCCDMPVTCPSGARPVPVDILQGFLPGHLVDISARGGNRKF